MAADLWPYQSGIGDAEREWVRRTMRGVPRWRPVRRLIEGYLDGSLSTDRGAPQLLIKALEDGSAARWRERALAAWAMGRFGPGTASESECVATLCNALDDRYPNPWLRTGFRRSFLAISPILVITVLASCVAGLAGSGPFGLLTGAVAGLVGAAMASIPLTLLATPVVIPLSASTDQRRTAFVRAVCAASLEALRQPVSAPSLAAAARHPTNVIKTSARKALKRVLPTLAESHYRQLGPSLVVDLCSLLSKREEELSLHAMGALEKVGDGRAVDPVARVARGRRGRLKDAAERILPVLVTRRERERQAERLLRPANAPVPESEVLLRPAYGPGVTSSEQLLRPVEDEDEQESAISGQLQGLRLSADDAADAGEGTVAHVAKGHLAG